MAHKTKSHWGALVTALVSGAYEVLAFLGVPPYSDKPVAKVAAFLVFAVSLGRIIYKQHQELDSFRNPEFDLTVSHEHTLQRDVAAWDANYCRVSVYNNSDFPLKDCQIVIEDWTFDSPSLTKDTALKVKDRNDRAMATDIHDHDTKQFDLFSNILQKGTDRWLSTVVLAPNMPELTIKESGHSLTFRLTGNLNTRRYKALLLLSPNFGVRITRIDRIG